MVSRVPGIPQDGAGDVNETTLLDAAAQISRSSSSVCARETQIIMYSFSLRSDGVSTAPASTRARAY